MDKIYVIGLDFGTDSLRGILVDSSNGKVLASQSALYPRWAQGLYCDAALSQFRQHPLDYIECLESVLCALVANCANPDAIRAISIDSTASTPCLISADAQPLSLNSKYANCPDAMFVLWKDHTAQLESEQISALCSRSKLNYAAHTGGHYSAECYWSKVLHLIRKNEELRHDAYAAIELCDYIPALLSGCKDASKLKGSLCAAGTKQMWAPEWGGFPDKDFFSNLDPDLAKIASRLSRTRLDCSKPVAHISEDWAKKVGLSSSVLIGTSIVDSHAGAVGAGISYKTMVLNLGTSAGYMAVMPKDKMEGRIIKGIFNQVEGSILPDMIGFEAGLSAFGDLYAWLKNLLSWPLQLLSEPEVKSIEDKLLISLGEAAANLPARLDAPIATDYFNGRRCPAPDSQLSGTIAGLKLSSSAPEIYYALVEATAFATRAIIDHLRKGGIEIDRFIAVGGISQKSPFVMQVLSDTLGSEIAVSASPASCSLGSAIHAAVVAGAYPNIQEAQKAMIEPADLVYTPNSINKEILDQRYSRYLHLARISATI